MTIRQKIFHAAEKSGIPVSVYIELTYRCNLKCIHCYIPIRKREKFTAAELTYEEHIKLLDDLYSLGTLYITYTGGEVFLRKDLMDILSYAKEKRFSVRVFTSGTLADEEKIKRLYETGIDEVEISIYGDRQTHEAITQVKNSYNRSINTAIALKNYGIPVKLKSPVMKPNLNSYSHMINLAKENGFNYSLDPVITPDDDNSPVDLSVGIEVIKDVIKNPDVGIEPQGKDTDSATPLCDAGVLSIAVSPEGIVYPCIEWRIPCGSIKERSIIDIWYNSPVLKRIKSLTINDFKECSSCSLLKYCPRCPGMALKENGSSFSCSKTSKKLALLNREVIDAKK